MNPHIVGPRRNATRSFGAHFQRFAGDYVAAPAVVRVRWRPTPTHGRGTPAARRPLPSAGSDGPDAGGAYRARKPSLSLVRLVYIFGVYIYMAQGTSAPLHIKDEAATEAVRRLARLRKLTLTEAVRIACEEALDRDAQARPIVERLADFTNACVPFDEPANGPTRRSSTGNGEMMRDRNAHGRDVRKLSARALSARKPVMNSR